MAESILRGSVSFMDKVGIYDVILPFLLVFTIVFAILEKTKILGVEKHDGHEYTKKNINAIVSFSIAFLVIASTQLVGVINEVLANIVLLLVLAVSFLLLIGVFMGDKEFTLKDYPAWVKFFMVFMFIAVLLIFLNALGWIEFLLTPFVLLPAEWASAIVFMIVVVIFMAYITRDSKPKATDKGGH